MNLAQLLLRSARLLPDARAIALGKRPVVSYGQLADRVARLASGFKNKLNLQPGDRVGLAMKNCVEYHEVLFACWHAGLIAVPMNAKLHPKEFAYILENSGAKACFVTPELESAVPEGTHRLVYTYEPRSFRLGGLISLVGIAGLGGFLAWSLRPGRRT